jgi:3-dehydroquinate synthase
MGQEGEAAHMATVIPCSAITPGELVDRSVYRQRVHLEFEYEVHFTRALFDPGNPVLVSCLSRLEPARRHRVAVFVDEGVAVARPRLAEEIRAYALRHGSRLELVAPPETVPGGEAVKNDPALVDRLQRRLLELGMDRHSYVVAIGGGAVLDAIGYVAATVHRGVRHVRVPTTVLAQDDSGVGVKNAVNAFGVKNFLGTFVPPFAVLNDLDFLLALGHRDRIAGMAEAVKVSLIRDASFFAWIEAHLEELVAFEEESASRLVRRCAELHMRHIASGGDPFEMGSARPLDFGHWSAHKLESLSHHDLRHGEAVAIGMALDTRYSVLAGMLQPGAEVRVCKVLEGLGFRLWHDALDQRDATGERQVVEGLREFREHLGGELTITLLEAIGRGVEVHEMSLEGVGAAIDWLRERDRERRR